MVMDERQAFLGSGNSICSDTTAAVVLLEQNTTDSSSGDSQSWTWHWDLTADGSGSSIIDSIGKKDPDGVRKSKFIWGHIAGVLTSLFWTISASCSQALGGYVPIFELNSWRYGTLFVSVLPVILYRRLDIVPKGMKLRIYLALFCLASVTYNMTYYEASIYLPAGILGGMESAIILILTATLTTFITGKFQGIIAVSVGLCVTGIVLLIQPEFIFGEADDYYTTPLCQQLEDEIIVNSTSVGNETVTEIVTVETAVTISDDTLGFILVTISSISLVVYIMMVNQKLQDIDVYVNGFWHSITGLVLSLPLMGITETPVVPQSAECILLLIGHSVSAALSELLAIVCLRIVSSFTYSLLSSLQVIFLLVAQYTVLKSVNPGSQNAWEIIGALLVLAASIAQPVYTYTMEKRKERMEQQQEKESEQFLLKGISSYDAMLLAAEDSLEQ